MRTKCDACGGKVKLMRDFTQKGVKRFVRQCTNVKCLKVFR